MTDYIEAYNAVDRYVEERYGIISTITDVIDPNTGDFDGSWIKVDYQLDPESALFVLLHLFGHTVQWNVSEEFRKLGQETTSGATAEQLAQIKIYEKQATQFSVQLLHECNIFDRDQWVSDWWCADWKWLSHFYKTGEKLNQFEVRKWIKPGEAELLTPLPIPEFTPQKFVSRWAF
ncbi:MAG TPA: hypothetical protein VKX17_10105 [Planctomycetota bacterium]|nr:hypothetical protein [Planctomycetota bacterium]